MKRNIILILILSFAWLQVLAQTSANYTYDNMNRLTKVTYSDGASVTYTYDALGNRLTKRVSGVAVETYTITVSADPAEAGSVSGAGTYSSGSVVELTAIPNEGYTFLQWDNGQTANPRTVTVNSNQTFMAMFEPEEDTEISQLANTIYLNRTTAYVGTQLALSVKMKNSIQTEGFQFDLYPPQGVNFVVDKDGNPIAYLSNQRTSLQNTNTFEAAIRPDGALRVFAASTNGSVIAGNDGEVCTVILSVSSNMKTGIYPLIIKEIALSDVGATSYRLNYVKSTLEIESDAIWGDVNGDGKVNIGDVTALINVLLSGTENENPNADLNGDGLVKISDVTMLIDYLLNSTSK